MLEHDPHLNEAVRRLGCTVGTVLESASPAVAIEGVASGINGEDVERLADCLQALIAEALQSWLDAGSEREVTMENEELHAALVNELKGWSTDYDESWR